MTKIVFQSGAAAFMIAALCLVSMIAAKADADPAAKEQQASPEAGDFEQWINTGWRFFREDTPSAQTYESPIFDDSSWDQVTLPHNSKVDTFNESHPWQGICWYRKTIFPDPAWAGQRVSIQFGAAMHTADVFINGVHRMQHLGGYLPFTVDITDEAQGTRPIQVAVELDNRDTDQVPPGTPTDNLDFNYPGGLYRGVKLIVTNPIHITDPIAANIVAGGGIFVTYSNVSDQSATVNVKTDVANDSTDLGRNIVVKQSLLGSDGVEVQSATSPPVMIPAGSNQEVTQSFDVESPQLWDPDHPNLYTLVTTVLINKVPVDALNTTVGIRTFALTNRVLINGKEVHIAGSNRHQEYPYIEYALSPNASARDAQRIKDAGLNHIRLSHYPQDPAFLDACDRLGILVQAPIPGWQFFAYNNSFVSTTYQNIRDLIRRDRNHPSIIFWESNLNETDGDHLDWCRTAYQIAHEEYPGDQCFTFGDSYPRGWKPGWDVKYFIREYGDFGFGGNESTSRHTRGEGEAAMLQQAWNFQWCHNGDWDNWQDSNSDFYGDATWCMFDYNRGYYPKPCTCGMMDIFRLPKYVYYFFQSQRDPNLIRKDIDSGPMLFIANDWTQRTGNTKVVVFSNCSFVKLYVNGRLFKTQGSDSGPDTRYSEWNADIAKTTGNNYDNTGGHPFDGGNAKHLDHPPFTFLNVPYAPGSIKAVGLIDGNPVTEETVRTPGAPLALKVDFDTQRIPLTADGADTVFTRIDVLDKDGTIVPLNALPSLRLAVSGPGDLIGVSPIHVEAGVASVLLQARATPGPITVTATADGLRRAIGVITSVPAPTAVSRTPASVMTSSTATYSSFTKLTGTVIGTPGSYNGGSTTIANAFDGNTATFVDAVATTDGDNCWVGLDLGSPKSITKIRFYPRSGWASRMNGGDFEGSNDPLFSHTIELYALGQNVQDNTWTELTDLESAQAFRYVRYVSPDDGWNDVAEIEFYTSP